MTPDKPFLLHAATVAGDLAELGKDLRVSGSHLEGTVSVGKAPRAVAVEVTVLDGMKGDDPGERALFVRVSCSEHANGADLRSAMEALADDLDRRAALIRCAAEDNLSYHA
jgi:hypothetical protein